MPEEIAVMRKTGLVFCQSWQFSLVPAVRIFLADKLRKVLPPLDCRCPVQILVNVGSVVSLEGHAKVRNEPAPGCMFISMAVACLVHRGGPVTTCSTISSAKCFAHVIRI